MIWAVRHWRGQLEPLTAALGSGLIAAALAIAILRLIVWGASSLDLSLQNYAVIEIGFYIGAIVVVFWALVGILRTAQSVRGTAGRNLVIFSAVYLALLIPIGWRTAIAASELGQLALGRDPLGPPASITRQGNYVLLEGMLSLGSAREFAKAASRMKPDDLLILNSPGGRLAEAEKIAAIIQRLGMKTHVDEECSSACTIVMLAGRARSADVGARIGFHQPTQDGNYAIDDQLMAEPLREYYLAANVDDDFVKEALSVPSVDLWYPAADQLIQAGVIGRVTIGYRLDSLVAFFESEKSWDLDKDFAITGAATDGRSLELRYIIKPKSRFRRTSENSAAAADQLVASSCADEDFAELLGHGGQLVLRPEDDLRPSLAIDRCDRS